VQPFQPAALVGSVLDGRYRLCSHLASGGMGAIFRAEHVYMRKELAVKLLRPELSALPDLAERFRREAEIAASLEHDHIVRVSDFGRSPEGWLFLAMELLEGESLFERMRAGPLQPEEAVPILAQVCDGLEAAHALGVVHRDLKPENVFLCRARRPWVKLLDFGIAKITDPLARSDTAAGVVVGTPEYVSPEQASGAPVDARADVYAVGIVGFGLLAGRHPFDAPDARALLMMQATQPVPSLAEARPDLVRRWPGLCEAIARACAKDPSERFQSAGALRDALLATLPDDARALALAAPRPSRISTPLASTPALAPGGPMVFRATVTPPRPWQRWRRWRRWALAAGLAVALGAAGGTWALVHRSQARRESERAVAIAAELARQHEVERAQLADAERARLAETERAERLAREAREAEEAAPLRRAEKLLAEGRAREARAAIAPALAHKPPTPGSQLLLARALHRIPGSERSAIDAFEAASRAPSGLDAPALSDLASLVPPGGRTGDRAARLLREAGKPAVAPVVDTALRAQGAGRLRALVLLRALHAEDRIPPAEAYGPLLQDADCDLRKAAAKRLGELGDGAALPKLQALAQAKREVRKFLFTRQEPECGAAEAQAAVARIESAHRAASP
jgi:serine/threonine-protein kinase